ncbi:MAG: competence protein F [Rickettsiales bacterium]|jgi:ComF family protein|nr:competence protein F [Rickettsiales bacterium]
MSFFTGLKMAVNSTINTSSCSFCNVAQTQTGICDTCFVAIESNDISCNRCASPIVHQPSPHLTSAICGSCIKKPPSYQKVITASRYQFPVDKALGELKFNKQLHYARSLCHVLERQIKLHYFDAPYPQAILAVPLHPKRLQERGFNQSDIIAKHLSQSLGIPTASNLSRVKDTPHQIGLSEKQRRKNLNNAFDVRGSLPAHIALVDDVVTTGSTVNEATRVCLKHGAQRVDVWCLAKT